MGRRCLYGLALALALVVFADAASAGPEACGVMLPFGEYMDRMSDEVAGPFNELGILGTLSGKVRSFTIWQDVDTYNADGSIKKQKKSASTIGFFLDYKTPEYAGLYGKLQYVDVRQVYDGEHPGSKSDPEFTQNGQYRMINELYLDYDLSNVGIDSSSIRVGRQIRHYDFFKKFALRQKEQSMEAVVLSTGYIDGLALDVGHMTGFSSWSSLNAVPYPTKFINIGRQMGVRYETAGATFMNARYSGIEHASLTFYDWIMYDLMNVLGVRASYDVPLYQDIHFIPGAHVLTERDMGRMKKDGLGKVSSYAIEVTGELKKGKFSIEPGFLWISPNKAGEVNDILHPFDTLFSADSEKGGDYTRQMSAGSRTFILRTWFNVCKAKVITAYYYTEHSKNAVNGATDKGTRDQQLETDICLPLTKNTALKLTFVYGCRGTNVDTRKDLEKKDFRICLDHSF
ncbi:MAG: hypothetical protein PHH49_02410 [Candidatus Omnitrophica bacterium]|nr:hypothetical protein [Candidatus Omnitrophota bacterium]MDD5487800.1 hypothetical protein [Candidatus Omnitrophota bacterium]